MKHGLSIVFLILILISCKKEQNKEEIIIKDKPKQIVLISNYAPEPYKHYRLKQDTLGKQSNKKSGPYTPVESPSFSYFDSQNNINSWKPKANKVDTLVIPYYREYLELSTRNVYTSIPNTYLVKNGDTVVFEYKNKLPIAKITNRQVNDIELNYNHYRLKELFNNTYSSHHRTYLAFIFTEIKADDNFIDFKERAKELTLNMYEKAVDDRELESVFLDSLHKENLISNDNYMYRKDVLNGLMENHKKNRIIKEWLDQKKSSLGKEVIETVYGLDLSKTDSLMTFSYFRDYLNTISRYNFSLIRESYGGGGSSYIDSRARFDSILKDKRFNQTAKNYLLFDAFDGINNHFRVKDKQKYFKKLAENTMNPAKITELQKKYKLDFSKSDKLVLTNLQNDTITFTDVINNNKGKWLYINFWASWCNPCRETMPKSVILKKELENKNIEFIYLGLNDKKEKWKSAIESDGISKNQNYFIENGNVSKVIESLAVKAIPHYLIYNPNGELVNGFANRPGKGAKEQLEKLINEK